LEGSDKLASAASYAPICNKASTLDLPSRTPRSTL
jgi:hypothetical protein